MSEKSIEWFENEIRKLKLIGAESFIIRIYEDELKRLKNKKNPVIFEGVP